jgi:hypothetical protein
MNTTRFDRLPIWPELGRYDLNMATCSAIATRLDEEMLVHRPAIIYPTHSFFGNASASRL